MAMTQLTLKRIIKKLPEDFSKVLKEVAHRLEISYDDLHFFRIDEIIEFLLKSKRKPVSKELQERKEKDWTYFMIQGEEKILYKSTKVKVKKEIEEIKGKVGYSGKVRGKIKIVFNKNQFFKIQKGDILVTSMTSPDFIPVLKKVSAIITDEGGITCHAAIVSREMKKPCIIGTKIATKVLKDGDLVEVDANKGIVRILKTI
jgi:pyruvate,water dikinase